MELQKNGMYILGVIDDLDAWLFVSVDISIVTPTLCWQIETERAVVRKTWKWKKTLLSYSSSIGVKNREKNLTLFFRGFLK